jgi:hypothetical protein
MSKILLLTAMLTVGVGLRLKPIAAEDSPSARAAAAPVSLARRASRDRTRRQTASCDHSCAFHDSMEVGVEAGARVF